MGRKLLWLCWLLLPTLYLPNQPISWYAALRITCWKLMWFSRLLKNDPTLKQDLFINLASEVFVLSCVLHTTFLRLFQNVKFPPSWVIVLAITASTFFVYILLHWKDQKSSGILQKSGIDAEPVFLPCRTTHSRMFPKTHSFSYSYLCVGIPVGLRGSIGSILSVDASGDMERRSKTCWFSVKASDYLFRKDSGLSLEEKLRSFLKSQNVMDSQWSYAYLVTAPRFLNYSFNPVSFWYLYSSQSLLTMMILEVNNTFDERRLYLLKEDETAKIHSSGGTEDYDHDNPTASEHVTKFTNKWAKDFHVSPFNSRKGTYSLSATDPLSVHQIPLGNVNNTIVLKSSKGHSKLVARLVSQGDPIRLSSLSLSSFLFFLARWSWVGFLTFPRITVQAWKLYFKRGLHVWYRPEVVSNTIGRRATKEEEVLELFFKQYLAYSTHRVTRPIRVRYTSATKQCTTVDFRSWETSVADENPETLDIRVITPAFYSRFVHYAHTSQAFEGECMLTDEKNRTVSISRPDLLPVLFPETCNEHATVAWLPGKIRWKLMRMLRCPPEPQSYSSLHDKANGMAAPGLHYSSLSPLDQFVRLKCLDSYLYRRCVTKIFLSRRFAFGFSEAVTLADFMARLLLSYYTSTYFTGPVVSQDSITAPTTRFVSEATLFLVYNDVLHYWSFLKGIY